MKLTTKKGAKLFITIFSVAVMMSLCCVTAFAAGGGGGQGPGN